MDRTITLDAETFNEACAAIRAFQHFLKNAAEKTDITRERLLKRQQADRLQKVLDALERQNRP